MVDWPFNTSTALKRYQIDALILQKSGVTFENGREITLDSFIESMQLEGDRRGRDKGNYSEALNRSATRRLLYWTGRGYTAFNPDSILPHFVTMGGYNQWVTGDPQRSPRKTMEVMQQLVKGRYDGDWIPLLDTLSGNYAEKRKLLESLSPSDRQSERRPVIEFLSFDPSTLPDIWTPGFISSEAVDEFRSDPKFFHKK